MLAQGAVVVAAIIPQNQPVQLSKDHKIASAATSAHAAVARYEHTETGKCAPRLLLVAANKDMSMAACWARARAPCVPARLRLKLARAQPKEANSIAKKTLAPEVVKVTTSSSLSPRDGLGWALRVCASCVCVGACVRARVRERASSLLRDSVQGSLLRGTWADRGLAPPSSKLEPRRKPAQRSLHRTLAQRTCENLPGELAQRNLAAKLKAWAVPCA